MSDINDGKWEYRVEDIGGLFSRRLDKGAVQDLLNQWGEDGWEVINMANGGNPRYWRIVAKRPLTSMEKRRRSMPGWDGS